MMTDPSMMTDMLKKNLNMIVPQMLTAAWVNFFFTGFVVGKVRRCRLAVSKPMLRAPLVSALETEM
jgi:hypothetical protein